MQISILEMFEQHEEYQKPKLKEEEQNVLNVILMA